MACRLRVGSGGFGAWLAGGTLRIGAWLFRRTVVGDGVNRTGLPHALALVIDDHSLGGRLALEAYLDGAIGQVAWSFKADSLEGESVVSPYMAVFFDKEQFIVGLIGWQETDTVAIQGKAIQRAHAQNRMELSVVLFLDPAGELAIEALQRREVQFQ